MAIFSFVTMENFAICKISKSLSPFFFKNTYFEIDHFAIWLDFFSHNPYLQSEQYVKLPFQIEIVFASIKKIPFFEGNLLEIPCKICQEILPSSVHFRRHCIDKHKKYNYSTENNESYCCEECGKTFKKTHLLTIHKRVNISNAFFYMICTYIN